MRRVMCGAMFLAAAVAAATGRQDPLRFTFDGRYGQVEVGGPFAGMEFHNSRPAPSRISFFSPVANSIDLSTDYWKRGESLPVAIGLRIADGPVEWISSESWAYTLSPHRVTFQKRTERCSLTISYDFCRNAPASVFSVTVQNAAGKIVPVELYVHLVLSLRTCQTYARRDTSLVQYDGKAQFLSARFDEAATDSAAIFIQQAGASPVAWAFRAEDLACTDSGGSAWPAARMSVVLDSAGEAKTRGVAAFVYRKSVTPSDSLHVVQIIGSCRGDDAARWGARLRSGWRGEIREYDEFIRIKAEEEARFVTGDSALDRSAAWARGLIAANAHFLNGTIVPMPCPAEYNFFFTHDLLLTNLGAVNFDLRRVKTNLRYLVSLAKDSTIPHAYYWRDDGYKTEYCEPENWNHLWFILVSGSYLRHSLDDSTGRVLYPFLTRSLTDILSRLHPDGLMYAFRPDWWDIGHIEGPRAYLTALAIRALREYLFISSFLHVSDPKLMTYERTADRMQRALDERLWDPEQQYLTNYNAGVRDYHFYAGSLIASVYRLLEKSRSEALTATARRELLDGRIGLRIAAPPDFNSDSVIARYKFAGAEAGPPYAYANGGVWPHGNAWYAMALASVGKPDESLDFLRRTMTLDGIAHSPNGLPAMYEYRYSDPASPEFGRIDKPSFLWAGGMYLQVLYRLFAVEEAEWNIGISTNRPSRIDSIECTLAFGSPASLIVDRIAGDDGVLVADGRVVPSRIMPLDVRSARRWEFRANTNRLPVLERINAVVHRVEYDSARRRLTCDISSFQDHRVECIVAGPRAVRRIFIDGVPMKELQASKRNDGKSACTVRLNGTADRQRIIFEY